MKKRVVLFFAAIGLAAGMLQSFPVQASPVHVKSFGEDGGKESDIKDYKEGQALVLYKSGEVSSKKEAEKVLTMGDSIQVEKLWVFEQSKEHSEDSSKVQTMGLGENISIGLVSSKELTTKQLIEKLEKEDNVELAEPNSKLSISEVDDPYFGKQWALQNSNQNGGESGNSISISERWKDTKGSDETVVAVVDTGVDYKHEELKENMWDNPYQPSLKGEHGFDFINGDADPMDDNGHGTHCAGVIGAKGNNGIGISGMNHNVKIMALKILDANGEGYKSDEINAYNYIYKAMSLGVNVVAINNSWGTTEKSEIFERLINLVGQKGAVSVCAAGNNGMNNDEGSDYPTGYESPYKIVVAASNEKGELASFSNYGKQSVDLAAPGTDILSTVSYDCYQPSLYGEEKHREVSEKYNDFEENVPAELAWDLTNISEKYSVDTTQEEYFGETVGKSLKISFGTLQKEECAEVRIPYILSEGENSPVFSAMVKTEGPQDGGIFAIVDVPAGTEVSEIPELFLMEYGGVGGYVSGRDDYWSHFNLEVAQTEESPETQREILLLFIAGEKGEYNVYLDDVGLSKATVESSQFGKYEFANGTSMAAPHVTGAIALEASENAKASVEETIDNVLGYVKPKESLSDFVSVGGVLDFSNRMPAGPRIGEVTVNVDKKQIILKGSGFDAENLEVKITSGTEEKVASIVKKEKSSVILSDNGWINRIVTISASGNGRTAVKQGVYLVKGKQGYTPVKDMELPNSEILATDGTCIYSANSASDSIEYLDLSDPEYMMCDTLITVEPEKYFKKAAGSLGTYDFSFGKDLVYMDGKLYNIVAYSEVLASGGTGEEDYGLKNAEDEEYDEDELVEEVAYSSEYKLFCFDPEEETITNLGALPSDLKRSEDWTLAGYNGSLYVIGGYDYGKKELSKTVKIYSPQTKKWTNGPALPEGRAKGKAIQTGNFLVYTLGCANQQEDVQVQESDCPKNLVLSGNRWTTSKQSPNLYFSSSYVTYGEAEYNVYNASVGLCAEGLIYAGTPADGLGDTFIYNANKDQFQSTKYSQIKDFERDTTFTGIAVGKTLYGFDQNGATYKLGINSGLVSVSASKSSYGRISNTNTQFLPGSAVKLTAYPKKGYVVKNFVLNGKRINGTSTTFRITSNMNASASYGKAVTSIKLNKKTVTLKAGKTFKLKTTIAPKNAYMKKVTYRSSNTKYATVSKNGVIKAKKAGRGKKVKIIVTALDGSGKKAVCTVKIKK